MRRAFYEAIVALVVVAGLIPSTAVSAGAARRVRYYEGTTSEGGLVGMSVTIKDGVPYLGMLLIDGPYSCEDGTQDEIAQDGFVWWPSDIAGPIPTNDRLEFSENAGSFAYTMSGHLGPLRGSGTLTVLMAGLTADERAAQVCTFGGTWSVERADSSSSVTPTMVVEAAGGRTLPMFLAVAGSRNATPLVPTRTGPVRHYEGGTTEDTAMVLRTSRTDTAIALLYLTVGSELPCEDGTEIGGGIYAHNYFDTTQVMPRGRLDLDIVPGALPSAIALHIHGDLDPHLGSGTVTMIWPQLTEDLRAQRCQTGEQDWTMWRTDAGY